jgi:anti-sigma B factor antagonist
MQLEGHTVGEVFVVKSLEKRIDASSAADFKGKIANWINNGHKWLVLDLSEVDFIDSSGLGSMLSILKTIGDQGNMVVCGVGETVMRLFRLTRMNRVFQIFTSQEEAVDALKRSLL